VRARKGSSSSSSRVKSRVSAYLRASLLVPLFSLCVCVCVCVQSHSAAVRKAQLLLWLWLGLFGFCKMPRALATSSSTSEGTEEACVPSSSNSHGTENPLVASLLAFLHAWTVTSSHPQQMSPAPPWASARDYLSPLPPPLSTPLPRSFRPCEMVPAVYLGSRQDVGTDAAALIQHLQQATTPNNGSGRKNASLNETSASTAAVSPAPQRMVLVARACPLPGVTAPQLELRVARARKRGSRRQTISCGTAMGQSLIREVSSLRQTASMAADSPIAVHDVEVTHLSLTELYNRLCVALDSRSDSPTPSSFSSVATPPSRATLAQWLCPTTVDSTSSPWCRGVVPANISFEDWNTLVLAMQDVLLSDCTKCVDGGTPSSWRDVYGYWRLVLPILDSPTEVIQPYFAITTLLLHAALSLPSHPSYSRWICGGDMAGEVDRVDAPPSTQNDETSAPGESVNTPGAESSARLAAAVPCVVVHCQAGKSRSVSFVAAFLL
jgi:hypothetical protein